MIDTPCVEEGERYLFTSQLRDIERYARLYYDLSINIEGIEAIHHLLDRVSGLREEVRTLRSRLRLYEPWDQDVYDAEDVF